MAAAVAALLHGLGAKRQFLSGYSGSCGASGFGRTPVSGGFSGCCVAAWFGRKAPGLSGGAGGACTVVLTQAKTRSENAERLQQGLHCCMVWA